LEIHPSEITIEGRHREVYGDLSGMIESIKKHGLIQPVTIDQNNKLLAGGRRYRACIEAGLDYIPCLRKEVHGELNQLEIELIENVHRKDLEWLERAKLENKIYELKGSVRDTASELGKSIGVVSRHLQLAEAVKVIPELAKFKTENDAWKALKKIEEDIILKELANRARTFAKALEESQALQATIKGFRLDLVKATRSPSINRAANEIEFDPSKLNIENRTAVDNFAKKIQAEFGRLDEATGEIVSDVIQAGPSQSGFPRSEILTAEAFKSQVTKIVDDELGAVQTQMAKLEEGFIAGVSRPRGDQFEAGEDAFEKFIQIRGRADQNIKAVYNQLTPSLVLPRQSFRTMPKAYQRALKVDAAGNKPPPEVQEMVKKMRGSFRSTPRGTTTEIGFDVVLGTTKKRVLEATDVRINTFGAVRELRSELGSLAAQAAKAGDRPLARRYNILRAEMNRVLDNAATQG
ncbi:hypothetical protein LCGC14_2606900, partial [marine sediment metagenome]